MLEWLNRSLLPVLFLGNAVALQHDHSVFYNQDTAAIIRVKKCAGFRITGRGDAAAWNTATWNIIQQRTLPDRHLDTKVKVLYSQTGLYFLFYCRDERLTSALNKNFDNLWEGDVAEVFIRPDECCADYLEYELSPLNYELPVLVANHHNEITRWIPFMYEGDRRAIHATSVSGGEKKNGAAIKAWTAECYIPYQLMIPLRNIHPVSGTRWNINFYRKDYDKGLAEWEWEQTGGNPHNYEKFGTMIFE